MTTSTICLPAHILHAHITPRAREVLMVLASQTSAAEPALWICQKAIAERLRCSVATIARSIQKLLEAKLIAETGKLHEGKYKFYHVRWSSDENLKTVSKKITKPVGREPVLSFLDLPTIKCEEPKNLPAPFFKGGTVSCDGGDDAFSPPLEKGVGGFDFPLGNAEPPPTSPSASTLSPMLKDSRIAYYAEIARQKYLENRRRYQAELLSMR